jgi:hypothetical protein
MLLSTMSTVPEQAVALDAENGLIFSFIWNLED